MGKPINDANRISVEEAARMVGMSTDSFRECMKQNKFPFPVGTAFKKEGGTNYTFYVYRGAMEKLVQFWGLCD